MRPERIVLVLSGGGMKAMAHVGVLRALEEAGRRPSEIIGTSGGALVGALVAGGLGYDELAPLVLRIRTEDVVVPARSALALRGVGASSVLRPAPLRKLLRRILPVHDFASLRLPLRLTATDLDSGELVVFGSGGRVDCSVADAVYASMALPIYYPPLRVGARRFADGGIRAVLPLDLAASVLADLVIAVDVGPVAAGSGPEPHPPPALVALHDRAMAIAMADQKARTLEAWRSAKRRPPLLVVTPDVDPHGTFAFDRTAEFIEAGYRAARAALAAGVAG